MPEKDAILDKIIEKYGSQKECAKALGMSESAFSIALRRRSKKFLIKLGSKGINIDRSVHQEVGAINASGEMILSNLNGKELRAEEHHHYPNSDQGLKDALAMAKEQIALYKSLLKKEEARNEKLQTELNKRLKKK